MSENRDIKFTQSKLEQEAQQQVNPKQNQAASEFSPEQVSSPELVNNSEAKNNLEHAPQTESQPEPTLANHQPINHQKWQGFDQVPLDPVHTNHYTQVNTESLIFTCLLLVVASLVIILPGDFYPAKVLGVSLAALLIISVVSYVRYQHAKSLAYAVCEHELIMQQGFWWVKRTSLPYSRLQHVSLSHGPLERHFNLATLKCFSAGSGSAEIELPGIEQQTAENLRQHLLNQAAKANPAAAPEATDSTPEQQITALTQTPMKENRHDDS
ncbi:PH domain-containing protein [Shewanella fidelis]|uniref:PH domain-containing protein n=1 Tax=Shewanella fidelis TaxID=173509 RepID=A0AAW8NIW2_9GAMM|nr:PH domain-containing protein [Shewanella fidelis]MDR8522601.1 PH domain-containing protein [Shewanella fidelis]MDW4812217.1 PH domain-containing protein [Shewanella fidelis]MDW4816119.1 PH domain-containing protein [Shewanella fidelis]MDW4820458.1 PH domain-containing protein [Shewanella fidelis]MDW4824680.1 PH domain-containing protein [Shewanella fidelis]